MFTKFQEAGRENLNLRSHDPQFGNLNIQIFIFIGFFQETPQ